MQQGHSFEALSTSYVYCRKYNEPNNLLSQVAVTYPRIRLVANLYPVEIAGSLSYEVFARGRQRAKPHSDKSEINPTAGRNL